ncbi:MAG: hypothetical protein GX270_05160 [Clostridiaceae bacterium]|jgi:hypothetical protein|nr:hypothetical protein [Clostridiaceae bacterium]
MKQITVDKRSFKLFDLLEKSLTNGEVANYPYGVFYGNANDSNWPVYLSGAECEFTMDKDFTLYDTAKFLEESKENFVFAAFSTTNIGEPILCVDGNYYGYEADEDYEEEIYIDEGDCYGYLIQVNEDKYTIDSVIYSLGGHCCSGEMLEDSVVIKEDCGIFEQPMQTYIKKFIM